MGRQPARLPRALAIKPAGAKEETFGVVFATARTQVDKIARTVVFEDMKITKRDFPTLPDHGAAYSTELQADFVKTIALDFPRPRGGLARRGGHQGSPVEVKNTPPQVIVSYSPAILVPIDGAPVFKPVPATRASSVSSTPAP